MIAQASDDPVDLVQRVAAGDREAFGRFYDRYAPLVFTMAMRVLRVRSDAEDLLQEVFLQAWRQADSYRTDRGSPEAWITTISRSRAIDRLRSIRSREKGVISLTVSGGVESGVPGGAATAEAEARLTVGGALASLSPAHRTVLELAYFDGLTQSEIANRLGEPLGTVKTRIRAGLAHLRKLLASKELENVNEPRRVA
jgi:RNA polymerase sigma-70 factor (ECF subfamily)